jgi:hypothetical protein
MRPPAQQTQVSCEDWLRCWRPHAQDPESCAVGVASDGRRTSSEARAGLRRRIVARPLGGAAIPAVIVVGTVAVLLTVCLVVLPVARDQIVQGKPVMTGGEVDALLGLTFLVAVDLGAAEEPWRPSGLRAAQIPRR